MKIQNREDTVAPNRIGYVYAIGVALLVGCAHKTGWIEILQKMPIAQATHIPRKHGRAYYRASRTRENGRGKAKRGKHSRPMTGCEALCWSVEQWYRPTIELLKAQELVKNYRYGDSSQEIESTTLQNLEKEWNEARTNMRLGRQDGGHCLAYFGDKVEYCRDTVSGEIVLSADLEAAVLPVCRRYLHMAKEYEADAMQCLKGFIPSSTTQ
mmetsp:Transcript_20805/g.59635  ORF Transcript_20805/g.59635 Transcript_20805/m.59635 type:complete len:211 (-) Transcript_20805:42-674(-)|eukprot:CAMPEP_0181052420 /NCGR_PEP_ID=MMETSP1070-20121207/17581_1 /TAXON_ID=265543 /ORGANISM="Minutocellus polymorphus, Strain NH13" /LENGTH=210 /DNA_ID=CAMNT_0023131513 /DNA_START=518 /DNA_END=1150 /DNA_ORIENTATION=+